VEDMNSFQNKTVKLNEKLRFLFYLVVLWFLVYAAYGEYVRDDLSQIV